MGGKVEAKSQSIRCSPWDLALLQETALKCDCGLPNSQDKGRIKLSYKKHTVRNGIFFFFF